MAECGECGAKAAISSEVRHKPGCRWQNQGERIAELEEALRLMRFEMNRVMPEAGKMSTTDGLGA